MFDVPPPNEGVRGIDDYRDAWPPFVEWQRSGAMFEITELDITASADVADPAHRLRLTLGLRKEEGRWVVAHEHHSFPDMG